MHVPQIKPTKVYKPQSFHWFLGQLLTFCLQLKAKKGKIIFLQEGEVWAGNLNLKHKEWCVQVKYNNSHC